MNGCLSCKACAGQCPVKVDIPEMKSRFLAAYHARYPRPLKDYIIARLERLAPLTAKAPALFNVLQSLPPVKWAFARFAGLEDLPKTSTRKLVPALHARGIAPFHKNQLAALNDAERVKSVLLIQDCFTTHYDVETFLGHVDLLRKLGYRVFVPPYRPNGKAQHVKGFLKQFDKQARDNDAFYGDLAQSGIPLIGIEPSVSLTYRQEYAQRLQNRPDYRVNLFHEWLESEIRNGRLTPPKITATIDQNSVPTLFPHCTEKTSIPDVSVKWQKIFDAFGIKLATERTGCCGMAGVYGHETANHDNSRRLYEMSWQKKAEKTGVKNMLVTGFSCRCQVKRQEGTRPQSPAEYLAKAL
jgi:Fe-S oxidoreductase